MRAAQSSESEFNKHLGNRIRAERVQNGASLEEVAKWLLISPQQAQKYEKGISRIHPAKLLKLAIRFGCSVDTFFLGLPGAEKIGGDTAFLLRECRAHIARWDLEHQDPRARQSARKILSEGKTE